MEEDIKKAVCRQMHALQNGVMTYYRLFDSLNCFDRFSIGDMASKLAEDLENGLEDYQEARELMHDVAESLCELDSCNPQEKPGDCEQQDIFCHIFDLLGQIKAIAEIDDIE